MISCQSLRRFRTLVVAFVVYQVPTIQVKIANIDR